VEPVFRKDHAQRKLLHDPEKWEPVSRLREALQRLARALDASAGEGRSEKIMRKQNYWRALVIQLIPVQV
jgi:hypothetical protein